MLRIVGSNELSATEVAEIRELMRVAFERDEHGGFTDDDWRHALGGSHFVLDEDGRIVSHAAVVERDIHVGGQAIRSAYVEAVATLPERQGQGLGTQVMRAVGEYIDGRGFEIALLGTSSHGFYERLGWRTWAGPSFVRTTDDEVPTPDEDGYIMFRPTPLTPALDLTAPISCEWRAGDVW